MEWYPGTVNIANSTLAGSKVQTVKKIKTGRIIAVFSEFFIIAVKNP